MKNTSSFGVSAVQDVYSGSEGVLWGLFLGELLHLGGLMSTLDLAAKAGIAPDMRGIDLCCGNAGGMRALLRFLGVAHMTGVDITDGILERGRERCEAEGFADRATLIVTDACQTGLPPDAFDFAWGEDAWCYVPDKAKLVGEAVRLVKPGGVVAFSDWVEGEAGMTEEESARLRAFMKFPNLQTLDGYPELLKANECEVLVAEDSGRFAPCMDLYHDMSTLQLGYDAFKALEFDMALMETIRTEMEFLRELAHENKIAQGLYVGRKSQG